MVAVIRLVVAPGLACVSVGVTAFVPLVEAVEATRLCLADAALAGLSTALGWFRSASARRSLSGSMADV